MAVFIETNAWAMVPGSDWPRVAIYDDGSIIFHKWSKGRSTLHQARVSDTQLEAMRAQFAPVLALDDLAPSYNLTPNMSDRPRALIYLRDAEREVATSVYGLTRERTSEVIESDESSDPVNPAVAELLAQFAPREEDIWRPPDAFLNLHQWFVDFDLAESTEWRPTNVEVMFWDYSYAPGPSIRWPEQWPDLEDQATRRRGEVYSVFLDGHALPELEAFLATQGERGAVEISGRKMAAAYRYPFPGESIWRAAFAAAHQKAPTSWDRGEDTSVPEDRASSETDER